MAGTITIDELVTRMVEGPPLPTDVEELSCNAATFVDLRLRLQQQQWTETYGALSGRHRGPRPADGKPARVLVLADDGLPDGVFRMEPPR